MQTKRYLIALIFVFAFLQCNKKVDIATGTNNLSSGENNASTLNANGKVKTFIIKQGAHYCTPNPFVFTTKSELKFRALFDSSCIYTTIDPSNQHDVNKLYGFSDCGTGHLQNSARMGWRWDNNELEILPFVHLGGNFKVGPVLAVLPIGAIANCRITCLDGKYEFEVNGNITQMDRGCSGNYTRYKLNPYFGGDETAPHQIKILLQELQ